MRYTVQPRDRIFVKEYGLLFFAKNIGKNISKVLSGKYGQKLLDHTKTSATDALKTTSKKVIQKTPDAVRDLIGNKIAYRVTKISRSSPQNNSETITNEDDKEIPNEICTSPEEIKKIIDDLRLI